LKQNFGNSENKKEINYSNHESKVLRK
jgi:hypothetical protein